LVHIGVRSVCAGMAALAIGFAAESVGWRVVGGPSTGQRTESALRLVFETIRPKSLDHHASLVRVASLETEFSLKPSVEEWEQSASAGARFFRRAFDQKLASFDERFAGGEIFGAEKGQRKQCTQPCTLAAARSGGARIAKACIGRFVTASERRKKRVATAEASKHSISPADEYTRSYPGQ
jgi:hypothetical protein